MLIRYHWGLGTGHSYAHNSDGGEAAQMNPALDETVTSVEQDSEDEGQQLGGSSYDQDFEPDAETGLEDRENDDLGTDSSDKELDGCLELEDDATLLAEYEMYESQAL
jgi:hypothetical protein